MRHPGVHLRVWVLVFLAGFLAAFFGDLCEAESNTEVKALNALRQALSDPQSVLTTWNSTSETPCDWYQITCNVENQVTRVDLGNGNLSGHLVPELGELTHLTYLELFTNNISGIIPVALGNLSHLVSLDLYENQLSGDIPEELGGLSNLAFLRLQNNSLEGQIPVSLTNIMQLQVLNLSYNNLTSQVPTNGSFSQFSPVSFSGNPNLCGAAVNKQCPALSPAPETSLSGCFVKYHLMPYLIIASTVLLEILTFAELL